MRASEREENGEGKSMDGDPRHGRAARCDEHDVKRWMLSEGELVAEEGVAKVANAKII